MKPYDIRGHYGIKTCTVEKIGRDTYRLVLSENGYFRFGTDQDGVLTFVDPSGGPFISVGTPLKDYHPKLPGKPIREIVPTDSGYLLVL